MIHRTFPISLLLATLLAAPSEGEPMPASLVMDLTDTLDATAGLDPRALTTLDGTLFFSGWHPLTGRELWASDGTPEGTRLVMDTCAGECTGIASSVILALSDAVYFPSCDASSTCQVWRSDGTAEGTAPVTRFSRNSLTGRVRGSLVSNLTEWNGKLYFQACDILHGCELYESDGTTDGTRLVVDLLPGPADVVFSDLLPAAGQLFGTASGGRQVWVSDGTATGTRFLVEEPGGFAYRLSLGTDDRIYYVANRVQLWTSDGTDAGTRMLTVSNRGITPLDVVSDTLYFSRGRSRGGTDLWYWDDVTASRQLIRDNFEGGLTHGVGFSGELYFAAGSQLWKSNGSPQGTAQVADLLDDVTEMVVDGDTLYVGTQSGLWEVDATGATLLTDAYSPSRLAAFRGGVAFAAHSIETGTELGISGVLGTALLSDAVDPGSTYPTGLTPHLGTLLFSTPSYPSQLYQASETQPSPRRLGTYEVSPTTVSAGGQAFILGWDLEVLGSDGAPMQLLDGHPLDYNGGLSLLREASASFAGALTFLVWRNSDGGSEPEIVELWASDGTIEGTRQLDELMDFYFCFQCDPPQPLPSCGMTAIANRIFAHFGGRLWVSDGRAGEAVELDIGTAESYCIVDNFTSVDDRLFFTTSCYQQPLRLFVSDGTQAGTILLREVESVDPDLSEAFVGELAALGETLFFVLEDSELGAELWTSDGTAAGTGLVRDIRPGIDSSNPSGLVVLKGRLYFSADDGVHGRELWASNGTRRGTGMVADLRPGPESSHPSELAAVGGRLFFSADDGVRGRELWTSKGGARTTRRLQDIQPGVLPSSPSSFAAAGSLIYFIAGTEATGLELWAMPRRFGK